ncbi:MAG: hypothetical protein AAGF87_00660 [Bacteroidota bacterium]
MATIQNSPTPPPFYNKPKKKSNPLLLGIIGVLAALNIFFLLGYFNRGAENEELTTQLDETTQLKEQAEAQYDDALAELDQMRGINEEMDARIAQQEAELADSKERIDALLSDSRNLASARRELSNLRSQVDGYVEELNQLREENAMLTAENQELNTTNETLSGDLENQREQNMQLSEERNSLQDANQELGTRNQQLNQRVTAGSAIMASSITAEGQRQKNNGSWARSRNANRVGRIHVCANTLANRTATPGAEVMLMRIIQPDGSTMSLGNQGSGTFRSEESGNMLPFTKEVSFDFDGGDTNFCGDWIPEGMAFPEGLYTIELYNKGYLAGSTELELK